MDWQAQPFSFAGFQAAAGVFFFVRHAPFGKGVFLSFVVNICQYLVNIGQYWSILINIRYCVRYLLYGTAYGTYIYI